MTILLAYISGECDRNDPYISLLPSGLCYLHAVLREAGHDSILANFSGWSDAAICKQLDGIKPDILGISQWTHNRHASIHLAHLFRKVNPSCLVVFGGGHATFRYREILGDDSPVDIVAFGEAEETMLELAERVEQQASWHDVSGIAFRADDGIVVTEPRTPRSELDLLPFPARYLEDSIGVDPELQSEFVLSARGCPSTCSFCSSPKFWGRKVRFRSPENIVDEILYIRNRYGLIYFSLRDDTFTADRKRTIEFCRLMIKQKASVLWNCQSRVSALDEEVLTWMKRAGCECIQLGVESGSSGILALLGKSIMPRQVEEAAALVRKVGINLSVYLISDVPGEMEKDIGLTLDLIRRIRPDDGYVSPLAYYPGTALFERDVAHGVVSPNIFEESHDKALYVIGKPGRTSRRFLQALASARVTAMGNRFQQQKALLGYCYTTNVLAGEWCRLEGDVASAEREFGEITEREPDNPWGWFLLGELYAEVGKQGLARKYYRKVCAIVPNHGPSLSALGKKKRGHDMAPLD
jgi:anaerobic magnesium-protoporphyrin IX monomethyl ester cyclase